MKSLTSVIIVAGGEGKRLKTAVPKQFLELSGKPVIVHTLERFEENPRIDAVVIVCRESYIDKLREIIERYGFRKIHSIVPGGETRQISSYNGLKACPEGTRYVLIHDAVRPFVDDRIINDVLSAAGRTGAAGPAIDIGDTIVEEEDGYIKKIPPRRTLKKIQTPQGFSYSGILKAHKEASENKMDCFTDDCGLILASGGPVELVMGSGANVKITEKIDFHLGEWLLENKDKTDIHYDE